MICHSDKPSMNLLRDAGTDTPSRSTSPEQARTDTTSARRTARVIRIKRQLQMGTYNEEAKIDAILDRLMADVLGIDDDNTPAPEPAKPHAAPNDDH